MAERTCTIDGCDNTKILARGWCNAHYKRWYRHGDPLADINRRAPDGADLETRLRYVGWTEVQVRLTMSPCWEWRGLRDRAGYGRVWDGTRVEAAHRASYAAWNHPDIAGYFIQHACDNPPCMNPAHLTRGTVQTNAAEMVTRGRSANGERKPQHKLTDLAVAEIRESCDGTAATRAALAELHDVTIGYIRLIERGVARTEPTHQEDSRDSAEPLGVRG